MTVKMIAAVSINGIIGIDNTIPWMGRYKDDMTFFRSMTKDSIVIMGLNTFISMGRKPLPKRINRIVSSIFSPSNADMKAASEKTTGCEGYTNLKEAIDAPNPDGKTIWLIGGAGIYAEGLEYANETLLTLIPEKVETKGKSVARFPYMHPLAFDCERRMMSELVPAADKQKLVVAIYRPSKTKWILEPTTPVS
jgi:dihydrofolate reductase